MMVETVLMVTIILSAILLSMGLGLLAILGLVNLISRFMPKQGVLPSSPPSPRR